MKHLLLAIFCVAFTANIYAENYSADTIVLDSWENNAWEHYKRTINTYDAGCQQLSTINQSWEGEWSNDGKISYSYVGDNLTEVLQQGWNGNSWYNAVKTYYTFDGSSKELTRITQLWSGSAWVSSSRETNTYDVTGYLISTLSEASLDGATWKNDGLTTYTNNADGTVNREVIQVWNAGTMSWENSYRASYTYNADKSVHQQTDEQWWFSSSWVNAYRFTFTYDAQGRESTQFIENGTGQTNAWVNSGISTITYHGSGEQYTSYVLQTWINNAWTTTMRDDYTYDNNDNVIQRVLQDVDLNYQLKNSSRYSYHYKADCILPLTLLDFTATLSGKDVLLKWATTNETNTGYFDVQSSTDADKFEKIGSVKAATNSTQKINYQFVDVNPAARASGMIYYRLKMTDRDGKFSYSKIAFVGLPQGEKLFSIFPTVVKDNLFLINNTTYRGNADIRIVDQAGRQVYRQRLTMQQAVNQSTINVSSLKAGVYYIQMITKDGANTAKFLKN